MIEITLKPTEPYKNALLLSIIHKSIKSLEEQAQWFYEHRMYRLEDLCDVIRYFYLDLITRHCKICGTREGVYNELRKELCSHCEWKVLREQYEKEWRHD